MLSKQSNKRAVESFIISNATQTALKTATTLSGTTAPYAVDLAEGEIGIYSASYAGSVDKYTSTNAPTLSTTPAIALYQGTIGSADPSVNPYSNPLWNRPYEETPAMDGRGRIVTTFNSYKAASFDVNFLGGPTGGQIAATDSTEYAMRIAFRGRFMDEMYNSEGANQLSVSMVTPDFTTLATAQPVDYIYQNTVWTINRNSSVVTIDKVSRRGHYPIVALAIDSTGATGAAISALTPGFIPLVNTTIGVRGATFTQAQIDALTAGVVAAGYTTAATLLTVDLTTAGTTTGGVADSMMTLTLAYDDVIPQVKITSAIGLVTGYDYLTVYNQNVNRASEGHGVARTLNLQYLASQGQRKYFADHEMDPKIEFPSPIDLSLTYDTIVINHEDANQIDTSSVSVSPQKSIVLIPNAVSGTVAGGLNAFTSTFNTALNVWLSAGGNNSIAQ